MRSKIIVANWKMNGSVAMMQDYLKQFKDFRRSEAIELVTCPPYHLIHPMSQSLNQNITIGAQNCASFDNGAFTGEVSCKMLADIGCKFVIIGHTERRTLYQETEPDIIRKIEQAFQHNITPIVCLYKTDDSISKDALKQLTDQCSRLGVNNSRAIIAYEPQWAIGSNIAPSANHIETVAQAVKQATNCLTIYGGSVNQDNMLSLLRITDGLLVGGFSLKFNSFYQTLDQIQNQIQRLA